MKNYKALQYNSHVKRMIIIAILPWLVSLIYFLTLDEGESINWLSIFLPAVLSIVLPSIMNYCRKLYLGILSAIDLDMHTAYMLDKRSERHDLINSKMAMNVAFFDGEFQGVIACADRLLKTKLRDKDIFSITHMRILSLFFLGQTEQIPALIQQQNDIFGEKADKYGGFSYYKFIREYLNGNYENAIQSLQPILQQKKNKGINAVTVLVSYLLRLAYLQLNDTEQVEKYSSLILNADKDRRTYFSKSVEIAPSEDISST